MVTFDGKKLDIFKMFFINTQLPKFEHIDKDEFRTRVTGLSFEWEGQHLMQGIPVNFIDTQDSLGLFNLNPVIPPRIRIEKFQRLEKLVNQINDKFNPPKDVLEIFKEIKSIRKEIDVDVDNSIQESYIKKIDDLTESGQKDAKFLMINEYKMYLNEQKLFQNGIKEYVTEEQMIEIYKNSPRLLRLDWLSHFIRPIPDEVAEKKKIADGLHIFDNYVVLHYDPFKTGTYLEPKNVSTKDGAKKEKERVERAKDPILFGVFYGSTRLYYIDDWIDEFCDLTFEKLKSMSKTEYIEKNVYKQMHQFGQDLAIKMQDFMKDVKKEND